jgi:hypothetical protein
VTPGAYIEQVFVSSLTAETDASRVGGDPSMQVATGKRLLAVLGISFGLLVWPPGELAARGASNTKVVCITYEGGYYGNYRVKPRHCTLHRRGKPYIGAYFTNLRDMHWRYWRSGQAKGRGKAWVTTFGPTPVKVKLFHPVFKCGHRAFLKAHVEYTELNTGGTQKIDLCTAR